MREVRLRLARLVDIGETGAYAFSDRLAILAPAAALDRPHPFGELVDAACVISFRYARGERPLISPHTWLGSSPHP